MCFTKRAHNLEYLSIACKKGVCKEDFGGVSAIWWWCLSISWVPFFCATRSRSVEKLDFVWLRNQARQKLYILEYFIVLLHPESFFCFTLSAQHHCSFIGLFMPFLSILDRIFFVSGPPSVLLFFVGQERRFFHRIHLKPSLLGCNQSYERTLPRPRFYHWGESYGLGEVMVRWTQKVDADFWFSQAKGRHFFKTRVFGDLEDLAILHLVCVHRPFASSLSMRNINHRKSCQTANVSFQRLQPANWSDYESGLTHITSKSWRGPVCYCFQPSGGRVCVVSLVSGALITNLKRHGNIMQYDVRYDVTATVCDVLSDYVPPCNPGTFMKTCSAWVQCHVMWHLIDIIVDHGMAWVWVDTLRSRSLPVQSKMYGKYRKVILT